MTNILYISYDGMTDPLGESQVISYLKGLSKKDCQITLISFEKKNAFEQKAAAIQQIVDESGIKWHPFMYTKKPPVISTMIDLWKMRRKAAELHKVNKYEIVHCRSYIASIVGLYLKKLTSGKIKFIFDMRGFWIEERVEGGMWNLGNPIFKAVYSFFKLEEKKFYHLSDKIISLTNAGKKYMVDSESVPAQKVGVIPTCVNFDLFKITSPQERDSLRQELNISADAKIFIYAGAVGGSYTTDLILKVYQYYKLFFKQTHLILLAKDSLNIDSLASLAQLGIQKNEITIIQAPFRDVHKYLNIGDVGYVFYAKGWSNIARSPTKLGEYLACGLPTIVFGDIGDIQSLKNDLGLFILKEISQEECFNQFAAIEKSDKTVQSMRQEAYEYCSIEKGIEFYYNIYQELLA